jgi:hypothetical protein
LFVNCPFKMTNDQGDQRSMSADVAMGCSGVRCLKSIRVSLWALCWPNLQEKELSVGVSLCKSLISHRDKLPPCGAAKWLKTDLHPLFAQEPQRRSATDAAERRWTIDATERTKWKRAKRKASGWRELQNLSLLANF